MLFKLNHRKKKLYELYKEYKNEVDLEIKNDVMNILKDLYPLYREEYPDDPEMTNNEFYDEVYENGWCEDSKFKKYHKEMQDRRINSFEIILLVIKRNLDKYSVPYLECINAMKKFIVNNCNFIRSMEYVEYRTYYEQLVLEEFRKLSDLDLKKHPAELARSCMYKIFPPNLKDLNDRIENDLEKAKQHINSRWVNDPEEKPYIEMIYALHKIQESITDIDPREINFEVLLKMLPESSKNHEELSGFQLNIILPEYSVKFHNLYGFAHSSGLRWIMEQFTIYKYPGCENVNEKMNEWISEYYKSENAK